MQKRFNSKSSSASKKSPYEDDLRISKRSRNGKDNWTKYGKSQLKSYVNYH